MIRAAFELAAVVGGLTGLLAFLFKIAGVS